MRKGRNRMRNKAEISAQIFTYILAAVVVAIILIVGGLAITKILDNVKWANISQFKSTLTSSVATVSRQYGTNKKVELPRIPDDYAEVCFVDSIDEATGQYSDAVRNHPSLGDYFFIKNSIDGGAAENVFFLDRRKQITENGRLKVDRLDVEEDFLCIPNEGAIDIWLKGTGKLAVLSVR